MATQTISALVTSEVDLTIVAGDDQILEFTIYNGSVAYDLASITSITIYLQDTVGGSTAYSASCTVTTATLGEFSVTITESNWTGVGYYYVNLVDGSDHVTTLVYGQVNIITV